MQQTNDTTALVQSGLTMSQTSDIESQLRSNIVESSKTDQQNTSVAEDMFNREEVMKFINDAGLLSYNIRALRINDYLKSFSNLFVSCKILSLSAESSICWIRSCNKAITPPHSSVIVFSLI